MSLLDKFSKVEVKSDTRISDNDKQFCEAHQSAYANAISLLYELKFFWEGMLESQKSILNPIGEIRPHLYLTDGSNLSLSLPEIQKQIRHTHEVLIDKIVHHFSIVYTISLSSSDTYIGSIESNQMQMVLCKEKLNRFMRGQDSNLDAIYEKFGVSFDLLSTLMRREADKEGKFHIRWGEQKIA